MENIANFNSTYGKLVDKYLSELSEIPGRSGSFKSSILLNRSPEYRIPPEIIEFLQILGVSEKAAILKRHAHSLFPGLITNVNWYPLSIVNINGSAIPTRYYSCSTCDAEPTGICGSCAAIEINFTDWVEFMHEKFESVVFNGSIFYLNCNPASSSYRKIMVTIQDNHGRQRFDVLYDNVEALFGDIQLWIRDTPSMYTREELIGKYSSESVADFDVDLSDIDRDLKLDSGSDVVTEMLVKLTRTHHGSTYNDAVEYGVIVPGDVLRSSTILENKDTLRTISDMDACRKKLEYDYMQYFGRHRGMNSGDERIKQIPEIVDQQVARILESKVFPKWLYSDIHTEVFGIDMYRHPCFHSFTVWYRVRYDLGFYSG